MKYQSNRGVTWTLVATWIVPCEKSTGALGPDDITLTTCLMHAF